MTQERRKQVRRQADRDLIERVRSARTSGGDATKEQRRMRRRAIRHHCTVRIAVRVSHRAGMTDTWSTDEHTLKGRILDLSAQGCSVYTTNAIEIGQELNLIIAMEGSATIQSNGVVRWTKGVSRKEGFAIGVEFANLQRKDQKLIASFLRQLDETVGL